MLVGGTRYVSRAQWESSAAYRFQLHTISIRHPALDSVGNAPLARLAIPVPREKKKHRNIIVPAPIGIEPITD